MSLLQGQKNQMQRGETSLHQLYAQIKGLRMAGT